MDVDEYFNMLFDKLEKCLKGTQQERILQECFGGKVVNQIICNETVRVGDQVAYDLKLLLCDAGLKLISLGLRS